LEVISSSPTKLKITDDANAIQHTQLLAQASLLSANYARNDSDAGRLFAQFLDALAPCCQMLLKVANVDVLHTLQTTPIPLISMRLANQQ
jgi:hypothetical protein